MTYPPMRIRKTDFVPGLKGRQVNVLRDLFDQGPAVSNGHWAVLLAYLRTPKGAVIGRGNAPARTPEEVAEALEHELEMETAVIDWRPPVDMELAVPANPTDVLYEARGTLLGRVYSIPPRVLPGRATPTMMTEDYVKWMDVGPGGSRKLMAHPYDPTRPAVLTQESVPIGVLMPWSTPGERVHRMYRDLKELTHG